MYTLTMGPRSRLLVALASTALIGYVALGSLLGRALGDTSYGQLAVFNEVVRQVIDHYVEPVNLDRAMAGARLGLGDALDGDSGYLDSEEFRLYQQPPREGDAEIGAVLTRRFAFLLVVSTRPGSPAEKAGIRPGDVLKSIDGRHSRPLAVPTGQRLLRGAPGSVVKLAILRAGSDPIEVSVVRERLAASAPKGRVLEDGTGYLQVREFPARVAEEVRAEVESLRKSGARGLVLDLRSAAYGAPEEGAKVAEIFLKGGVVAKLAGTRFPERVLSADAARAAWDGPLAVLVDNGSAGPAEIVAAAMLDSGRASVVGERTFGRAGIQQAVPLPEGGMVLTVARYSSPKGNAIHGRGVEPDVPVASAEDEEGEGAPSDPILEKALEVLREGAANKAAA
ncbi:MAG TPA: S41 family peptidase [Vicinamibacteria bacterium]|nr:S41 family peptidase [Vicinamibacteria bacterium]